MPLVSVIVPCYNEQATIAQLLAAIYAQTYSRLGMEVVIADGLSSDRTRLEIAAFAQDHPDLGIRVVDNPQRHIPAALNQALKAARGEIIIRLDAHSQPYPDYIERCVADLEAGLGENVGGVWEIRAGAETRMAYAIASAASHPLGAGDALYRHTRRAADVDTVPFGAFKRELLALVGFFDETLLTNEDYEFNARIRQAGGHIWLDPAIRSIYYARPSLAALARQYFRYGFWKWRMLRRYPRTRRWRQVLPPLFVASLAGGFLLALFLPIFRILLAVEIAIYAAVLAGTALQTAIQQKKTFLIVGFPLAIAVMHLTWGAGFLWSMIKGILTPEEVMRK